MNRYSTVYLLLLFSVAGIGQETIPLDLHWEADEGRQLLLTNEGYDSGNLPVVFRRLPLAEGDSLTAELRITKEKNYFDFKAPDALPGSYKIRTYTEHEKGRKYGTVFLYPMHRNGNKGVTILESGELRLRRVSQPPRLRTRNVTFASRSVLNEGKLLKLAVTESTVYKLRKDQLPADWTGSGFDPGKLQVFTGHPGMLPYGVDDPKIDDLQEVAYYLENNLSGSSDAIYFYAQGGNIKVPDREPGFVNIEQNIYSDTNFYFLRYGTEEGRAMPLPQAMNSAPSDALERGSDAFIYKEENHNILEGILQGSGRVWYTDAFTGTARRDYSSRISSLGIEKGEPVLFSAGFAGRSDYANTVTFSVSEKNLSANISSVTLTDRYGIAARHTDFREIVNWTEDHLSLSHETRQSNSRGWLEYFRLSFEKALRYRNEPLYFSLFSPNPYVRISGTSGDILAMDVSDPFQTRLLATYSEGDRLWIRRENPSDRNMQSYIIFRPSEARAIPDIKTIKNQNLHKLEAVDYLIIYHPLFERAVSNLADHRTKHNGFKVEKVNVFDIYNEFSSGKTDPSAIRNFLKMLYDRGNGDIRVILFGDGSFTYKYDPKKFQYPDENFIPVFETENSLNPIRAFPSDDYYALLDDREGGDLRGALDISMGRLPVRSVSEADIMVRKIIDYETDSRRFGDWRKEVLMVADDGNYNLFVGYTERLTENIEKEEPRFQLNKAYIDGYPKQNAPNGVFSPQVNDIINSSAFRGQLMINYQGHGSSKGWADEAILSKVDLEKWNNAQKYPVLVTATCTFAGFDDPKEVTAGEYSLVLPDKGAIALFTTTRVVYANSNDRLTNSLFDRLMERIDEPPELGEWIRLAKNANRSDTLDINSRKFTLLGDPAMKIGLPKYQIDIDQINEKSYGQDTIRLGALEKVKISGRITDYSGETLRNFNGELQPTLFDKKKTLETLGQGNENSPEKYSVWQNILYQGRASVTNGEFEFEFIIPKDINYATGPGRLILYADNGTDADAWGLGSDLLIGGTASDPIENDHQGPDVEIFLGDRSFVSGDEISPNSVLILDIEDPSGINVSGNGIGHDLIYYLDGDVSSATVLNSYFSYDLNSYTKGKVEFPVENLEKGRHTLTIKVWDSYNNFSEKSVEFYVNKKDLAIERVLNYPNPFFDRTEFQFENPLIGEDIKIVIDIFTPSGRMVHRIIESRNSSSQLLRSIFWDGRDQWNQKLANGVYIYKVKIIHESGNKTTQLSSSFQKLLILN